MVNYSCCVSGLFHYIIILTLQGMESTQDYLAIVHQRVTDNYTAQAQREKRRRRVLVEQMKALHEQEVIVELGRLV